MKDILIKFDYWVGEMLKIDEKETKIMYTFYLNGLKSVLFLQVQTSPNPGRLQKSTTDYFTFYY